ncbi:MAG: IS66 family transposase [Gammaproteobacteria bacterium]|nr:IS66 family transposase [Gammaproteobacteria bacterium]
MKFDKLSVNKTLDEAEEALQNERGLSLAMKSTIKILILIIRTLTGKLNKNSSNSSIPPAADKKRKRGSNKNKSNKKPGGQDGHDGFRLEKSDNPDKIETIEIDRRTLPKGKYRDVGFDARQVIDFEITTIITEYRAQALEDANGLQFVAHFPLFVTRDVQYGYRVKSNAVYLSQFQMIPYARIQDYFAEKMNIPISAGSIFNFNKEAYAFLEKFESIVKSQLIQSPVLNADETGINVNKKTIWLHCVSNPLWAYFFPHEKRGTIAMNAMGILPNFTGTLVHDHWKPYYTYSCLHALCNSHHIRELEYAAAEDNQVWAASMQTLLLEINDSIKNTETGALTKNLCTRYGKKYDKIIADGEIKCPLPEIPTINGKKKRGRIKKSKSRNLLERLRDYKEDTLRFMYDPLVPFTNNAGENDLRMTKVQQKVSGCFRSMEGAKIFCRIRSYILTCQRHDVKITDALELLFQGKMPAFIDKLLIAAEFAE